MCLMMLEWKWELLIKTLAMEKKTFKKIKVGVGQINSL